MSPAFKSRAFRIGPGTFTRREPPAENRVLSNVMGIVIYRYTCHASKYKASVSRVPTLLSLHLIAWYAKWYALWYDMSEVNWREMFQVQEVEHEFRTEVVGECNGNCLEARELKCVCHCRGKNHGAHLKQHVQPLERFNEPQELAPEVIAA